MKISKLFCYGNLLFLAFVLCVFRYGFLEQQPNLPLALNDWQFILLVISFVGIAAGGFVINNITGKSAVHISTTFGVTENTAYYFFAAANIIGVGLGFYLSNFIGKPGFSLIFILISITLYLYASNLKHILIVNNLIVAAIVALSILILGVFNLYPMITEENRSYLSTVFQVLMDFSIFTFFLSFVREIVKNLRDIDQDYNAGTSTLPIILGKERATKIVFALALIPVGLLLYYANTYIIKLLWSLIYGLIFILGPMIYFLIKIWGAKTSKEFGHLNIILKIVMAFTAFSIVVITYNIKYNA